MIKRYCADYENNGVLKVRGIDVSKNSGKGNAMRVGFLYSKGDNILIIDADGATDIADYQRLQDRVSFVVKM
jgi:glycosyltransferase involved in cell wall biosynthesis